MLRTVLVAALALGLAACDSGDTFDPDGPVTVRYAVSLTGGTATDVVLTYTDADGQDVTVTDPALPFSQTVTLDPDRTQRAALSVEGTTTRVTVNATVAASAEGQRDLTSEIDETYVHDPADGFDVTAVVSFETFD